MKTKIILAALLFFTITISTAQKYTLTANTKVTKNYKGSTFSSEKTIAQNTSGNTSFTYLSQILSSEVLQAELAKEEMVTIFAPDDTVFNALQKEDREVFLNDTAKVSQLLKSHAVPGRLDAASIKKAIQLNGGKASFNTLSGTKLNAKIDGDMVILFDEDGNKAVVKEADFYHKNGFFHIIEGVAFSTKPSETK